MLLETYKDLKALRVSRVFKEWVSRVLLDLHKELKVRKEHRGPKVFRA